MLNRHCSVDVAFTLVSNECSFEVIHMDFQSIDCPGQPHMILSRSR